MDPLQDFVPVADVVKAVGLKGEIKIYPFLDWYEPLLDSGYLEWDDGSALETGAWRPAGGCYVLTVEGIADRDAAEAAVGRRIGFLRSRYGEDGFPKPQDGLPFRYLGRSIECVDGETIGEVDEVRAYAAQIMLVVRRDGREILIPAVEPILRRDQAMDGPLVVDPPEGLLDVAGD